MTKLKTPKLEERFLEPEGWRYHVMERGNRKIRFGFVFPKGSKPDLIIVCLPGLSEFCEKYYELARDCLKRNYAFWVLDWAGQGLSSRLLYEQNKRHSHGFDEDIKDLEQLIDKYVRQITAKNNMSDVPLGMIAHSMGANIGLRYVHRHPGVFSCAALSAPMVGLKPFRVLPNRIAEKITGLFERYMPESHIIGLKDWRADEKLRLDANPFSGDRQRSEIHKLWCKENPELNAGLPTHGWLHEAVKSCAALEEELAEKKITIPCLLGYSGYEQFIDNMKVESANTMLRHARLMFFEEGRHEILMEEDKYRNAFLKGFYKLVDKYVLGKEDAEENAPET